MAKFWHDKWKSFRWRTIFLVLCANLFVYGLAAYSLFGSLNQHRDRAAQISHNTNQLVAQAVAGDFDRIDLGLKTAVDEFSRLAPLGPRAYVDVVPFLERIQGYLPMAAGVYLVDGLGNLTNGGGANPVPVSDRSYFKLLRDDPGVGLAVSEPVLGRVNGKWVLIFARRLQWPDGRFAGLVMTSVPVDWFSQRFARLEVGPRGAVVLRGDASRDFDLLARHPFAGYVGQTKVSDTFRATIGASPKGGTYVAPAGADGITRTFSYSSVGAYPFITLVGLAYDDTIAGWWGDVYQLGALSLVFTLFSLVGGYVLNRSWRALEARTEDLARSNADLEQFAYVASHDLQTPLRNIASFTQLLERRYRGRLDADADQFIAYVVDGAKRMSQLVNDLLDYARVSTAPQAPMAVDLMPVVGLVLSDLQPDMAGVEIQVGDLPPVLAEPLPMERLFHNLIDNSLRYRHPDRPLSISIQAQSEDQDWWRVEVRDNGIGIDPQYQSRVFAMFQRLNPNAHPESTGIGLSICRRIIFRYGGRIWIESGEGLGTAIVFTLPKAPPAPHPVDLPIRHPETA